METRKKRIEESSLGTSLLTSSWAKFILNWLCSETEGKDSMKQQAGDCESKGKTWVGLIIGRGRWNLADIQ